MIDKNVMHIHYTLHRVKLHCVTNYNDEYSLVENIFN